MRPDEGGAGAVLEVDLRAIVANWRLLGSLHPSGPVAGVVKADGYGLGARPVAPLCTGRAAGISSSRCWTRRWRSAIACQARCSPCWAGLIPGSEADFLAHDIVPVLGSLAEIDAWTDTARTVGRRLPAILHVDTGMSRLGLDARELAALRMDHGRLAGIELRYVMTHLVSSEVAGDSTEQRCSAIASPPPAPDCRRRRAASPIPPASFSAPASGPTSRGRAPRSTASTRRRTAEPDAPPVRLRARVLAVRDVPTGDSVGYNATWRAARPSRIATAGARLCRWLAPQPVGPRTGVL